ncbi:DUF4142 domain-containing protein [Sphingomonas sp. KR1UV-12]|uniref:DUF4142 domain-containing protein n=1 Tax=Sphingomonas aurea TaxID=3063994 RepID=A0ABT9EMZ1_9SPHN|nr:DUF4142 domain-containing protein [Sphingomonas sp. KR1UV-12]MDP1028322.1 DUF4142 domain-containing protein [Sphingomonas sp. KR1UV-12]
MNRFLAPIAIVAAVVVAGPAAAQPMAAKTYVAKAGASDLYERQSSQLVLATTQNAGLRDFANQMIADHTKSTADVKAAAKQAGIMVPPPKLEPMQARNIAALRAAKGEARDRLYVQQQKTAHQMALQLHQSYSANGTSAPLKAVATSIVPVVQGHLQHVEGM